jgi:hypothetical protein
MKLPKNRSQNKQDKEVFKNIFKDHWDEFKATHRRYDNEQYEEAVQKMLGCGEEFSGYSEYICMYCGGDRRKVPFSCKSCFCLSCAKKYVDDFVSQVSAMLHPGVIYRHIVLTIPEQLRDCFYKDRHNGDLLSAFMRCGYECLEDVVSTVKRKTLKIGCIVVVQTHGRSGHYNPHLHIIMTSGGVETELESWFDLGYFKYEIIHKKWQYYLFRMVKSYFGGDEIDNLVDELWKKYPNGLVANVSKGEVPESSKGLARYLAKYVASPPIAVRRIVDYDGQTVTYWYQDHKSKSKKIEKVDVFTFIGRMVQHILPKWFQRVRYYGLEATKTFKRWGKVIQEGIKRIGRMVKGAYQIVNVKKYRERYKEISGCDPMICRNCGREMELLKIWHPKYGVLYDEFENLKAGRYESKSEEDRGGGCSVRPSAGGVQLSLFPVQA